MLIDSHAHYDDAKYDDDRDEALLLAKNSGVDFIINAGSGVGSSRSACALAGKYGFVYSTAGVHPQEAEIADKEPEATLAALREMLALTKTLAVGEIGLDYYYGDPPREIQMKWFTRQMELASELKKPVVIHDREAHADTLAVMRRFPDVTGVVHSFSGSVEMLREVIAMGYFVSFGGVVTFKNAVRPVETVAAVPRDRLLLETDAPYLAPHPFRGKRNGSEYIVYTARRIAELRNVPFETLCDECAANTVKIYGIPL